MRLLLVILFCACWSFTQASAFSYDSIGTEEKEGKWFILHEVAPNETLYSLSRRYNVPIYRIIENNPPTEYGLEEGQIIRIPLTKKEKKVTAEKKTNPVVRKEKLILKGNQVKTEENQAIRVTVKPIIGDIIHEVKQKETLFSISRLYGVNVDDIKQWNNLTSNDLDIGQQLVIKKGSKSEEVTSEVIEGKTHKVAPSETLYSISKKYNVGIDDLRIWNNLSGNELKIGQLLRISLEEVNPAVDSGNGKSKIKTIREKDTIIVAEVIDTARYNIKPEQQTNFEEVVESGLAEQIGGTGSNRKYLALHKTAKTGTLIRVRNEMNNQEIFVRVIGPLPDTSDNKNHVIKISKAAYNRLGAIDPKFRVTISYIP